MTQCSSIYMYLMGVPHVSPLHDVSSDGRKCMHRLGARQAECSQKSGQHTQIHLQSSPRQSSPSHNRAWAYLVGQAIALCGTLLMLFTGDAM